ncbi:uncharacterized protein MELLADRAFT_105710 [Melampsora larici-populina 98AG31]|uniref:C2H2-type domain-containing protein n=1 Tax=Melampsora larici-populina (strain 98AG31 / pathotype 3-4-7) TaxID=747676 RepID=F4RJ43_MELLP|nr:uncharacterized protein MELLADRAFT_105710 [Melampsora larici-populina 98AG31]EGG07668.1 hypothetical protein MELLADRAFT_105710 [Melampsora larici-populina 98AG31]
MFSTIPRPESVSQPSSAVLNRFSTFRDPQPISSPLSMYNNSPVLTPTIASPALPKGFSSHLNSPRNFNHRDGRTHIKSKTCHGFSEIFKLPSSPSDQLASFATHNENPTFNGSSTHPTWTLKSPAEFSRRRSHTTPSSCPTDSQNHDSYQSFGQNSPYGNNPQPFSDMMSIPDADLAFTLGEPSSNLFYTHETNATQYTARPIEATSEMRFAQVNAGQEGSEISPPPIKLPTMVPNSMVSQQKHKHGGNGNTGVRKTKTETVEKSDAPAVSVTPGGYARKYACVWDGCGKAFTTSGHLARHNRIHTGEKRYECLMSGCHSRFSRQDNMLQHYRTHLSGKCRRLPSVSSTASSNDSKKTSDKRSREKMQSSSHETDATSNHQPKEFPESVIENDFSNMIDYHETVPISAPPPISDEFPLIYDDSTSFTNASSYTFSPYPPFELQEAELIMAEPEGFRTHDMNTYLSQDRGFPPSAWPFDYGDQSNQQVFASSQSYRESDLVHNPFGNSFTNLQYSLPDVPQDLQEFYERNPYEVNHQDMSPFALTRSLQSEGGQYLAFEGNHS